MKAVLIDDEQNNLDNLGRLLETYCPEVTVVDTALNAVTGRKAILMHQPDLVFLDIQMPGENGFDLLKSLPDSDFDVVFVTAYDHYGIQAVKFSAVDYLLKPIHPDELISAVRKVSGRQGHRRRHEQLENLLQQLNQSKEEHRIALPTLRETRLIRTRDIIRLESSNNYSHIYLTGGEKLTASRPIHEYEDLLTDYGFLRPHQSHLVNRVYIKSLLREDGGTLLLEDGSRVPVSRNKKGAILEALGL
jgi:two-component system LytT family response regulator